LGTSPHAITPPFAAGTRPDVEKAVQLYRKAIDVKPDYALPWARLASAYLSLETLKGTPSADDHDNKRILDALDRAIRLDPTLVWAYYTRAGFQMNVAWDWASARADQERMREVEPGNNYLLPSSLGDVALTCRRTYGPKGSRVGLRRGGRSLMPVRQARCPQR